MNPETPTPRTVAAQFKVKWDDGEIWVVESHASHTLERELIAIREECEKLKEEISQLRRETA